MKKLLLLCLLMVLPFSVFAKFYKATLIYKNGNSETVEARFPLSVNSKTLVIKRNGDRDRIDLDNISFLKLDLNNGQDSHFFKRGKVTYFRNNGKHKSARRAIWSLLDDINGDIVTSFAGFRYTVKKSKGEEKVVIRYNYNTQGYFLSKPDEDLLVSIEPTIGLTLKKMVERCQDYLFPKCPNFSDQIEHGEIKKGEHIQTIVKLYQNCSN